MRTWAGWCVLLALLAACGDAAGAALPASSAAPAATIPEPPTTLTAVSTMAPTTTFECPITIPTEMLAVPDTHPPAPSFGMWYGTADLWTVLAIDGSYAPRKGVFWSQNFPGGVVEEKPDLTVTWQRLDTADEPIVVEYPQTTNANTADEGWFMMAGIDPDEAGCWQVAATYKGATLSYVYERP